MIIIDDVICVEEHNRQLVRLAFLKFKQEKFARQEKLAIIQSLLNTGWFVKSS